MKEVIFKGDVKSEGQRPLTFLPWTMDGVAICWDRRARQSGKSNGEFCGVVYLRAGLQSTSGGVRDGVGG